MAAFLEKMIRRRESVVDVKAYTGQEIRNGDLELFVRDVRNFDADNIRISIKSWNR